MDNSLIAPLLMGGLIVLVGLTMIVLALWLSGRKQDQAHAERMKALELGQLPDVLRASAEMSRTRAAATVGVLVPLMMAGAAAGGTALVLAQNGLRWELTALCVIWGVCGVVSLVTVTCSLGALRRRSPRPVTESPPVPPKEKPTTEPADAESKASSSVTV